MMDSQGLSVDLKELHRRTLDSLGEAELKHLNAVVWRGRLWLALSLATLWHSVNPFAIFFVCMFLLNKWLLMHQIGHGGYDKVPGVPKKYLSKNYAMGWRRFIDWPDWMMPEVWNYEHNYLHHYFTGEAHDPDLVESNVQFVHTLKPAFLRYVVFVFAAVAWKFIYYAPNTMYQYSAKGEAKDAPPKYKYGLWMIFNLGAKQTRDTWLKCYLPYVLIHFVLLPGLFAPLGLAAMQAVLINRIIAELLHNAHMFAVIVTNHAGSDLYRFEHHYNTKDEFYLRQIIGSVNFNTGSEWLDYSQMWLNYQIEHHVFPALPMLTYRKIQPEVKALCEKHNVPYIQESVFKRVGQLLAIFVGRKKMLVLKQAG